MLPMHLLGCQAQGLARTRAHTRTQADTHTHTRTHEVMVI